MSALDVLSWSACFLLLVGLELIGRKKISGFFVAFIAEILWIWWAARTGAHAMVVMSGVICVMYLRAIWNWRKS
jgi:hypothetical protein